MSAYETDIICPSGLAGIASGLTVKDANTLSAATRGKRVQAIDRILASCWKSTSDLGPYERNQQLGKAHQQTGNPSWPGVLIGDRQHALIRIRAATWGEEYEFKLQCDQEVCKATFRHKMLLSDLPVQRLPDASRETFAAGNRFELELDGLGFVFALPTGEMTRKVMGMIDRNRENAVLISLRMRILEMTEGGNTISANDINSRLARMPLRQMSDLLDAFDERDCGIDGSLRVECPECWNVMEEELPFGASFFSPERKKMKKRRQT